jgi:hypothetical protein
MTTYNDYLIPEDAEPFLRYLTESTRTPEEIQAFLGSFVKHNLPYVPGANE